MRYHFTQILSTVLKSKTDNLLLKYVLTTHSSLPGGFSRPQINFFKWCVDSCRIQEEYSKGTHFHFSNELVFELVTQWKNDSRKT